MKNRKALWIISALLIVLLLALPMTAHGDAGNFAGDSDWDTGWDSGSDWDTGYDDTDWDTDWDDDTDYYEDDDSTAVGFLDDFDNDDDNTTSAEDDEPLGAFPYIVIVVIAAVVVFNILRKKKKGGTSSAPQPARAPDNNSLQDLLAADPNFSIPKFTEDASNLYVRLQNAWQEKDLSPVRSNMTDNLYAQFERQLQPYIANGKTNRVENIAVLRTDLKSYRQDDVNDILTVELHTRIVDYVVDDATGSIVKGSDTKELFMGYEYTFIRTKGVKTGQAVDRDTTCPNCGAPLDINHSGKCPYCDSVLNCAEYTWALSSIKGLYQKS